MGQAIINILSGSGGVISAEAKARNKNAYRLFDAKNSALIIPSKPSKLKISGISKANPNKKVVLMKKDRYSFTVINA